MQKIFELQLKRGNQLEESQLKVRGQEVDKIKKQLI